MMTAMSLSPVILSSLTALVAVPAAAVNNGLARTPQLGWNTWNAQYATTDCSEACN